MPAIASNQLIDIPISLGTTPKDPRAVPLTLDFSIATGVATQLIDLTNAQQRQVIDVVQSIYIDMSGMTAPMSLTVSGSNQFLIVEPASQGFYPLLSVTPLRFTFASTLGAGSCKVYLLNMGAGSSKWNTTTTTGPQAVSDAVAEGYLSTIASAYGGGSLTVRDTSSESSLTTLAGTVTGSRVFVAVDGNNSLGALSVTPSVMYSGSNAQPLLRANRVVCANFAGTASGALITGAPGYYISGAYFSIFPSSTLSSAGVDQISLVDSSFGTIWSSTFSLPSSYTAQSVPFAVTFAIPPGYFWNNKTANSSLSISMTAALATWSVAYTLNYGICSWVG